MSPGVMRTGYQEANPSPCLHASEALSKLLKFQVFCDTSWCIIVILAALKCKQEHILSIYSLLMYLTFFYKIQNKAFVFIHVLLKIRISRWSLLFHAFTNQNNFSFMFVTFVWICSAHACFWLGVQFSHCFCSWSLLSFPFM